MNMTRLLMKSLIVKGVRNNIQTENE